MNLSLRNGMPVMPIGPIASPMDFSGITEYGLYIAEATQRHALGRRTLTWDGRVFRYARCGNTFTSTTCGVKNLTQLVSCRVDSSSTPAAVPEDTAAGATQVTLTIEAAEIGDSTSETDTERTGVVAKDELAGGYVHFQTIPVAATEHDQNRLIVGNDAVGDADLTMTIYLDAPLNHELTALTSTCEILASPYANIQRSNDTYASVLGMPNVVAETSQHLWLQTWGPLRITPTTDSPSARERQWVFSDMGAVVPSVTDYGTMSLQHAGFLLESTSQLDVAYHHSPFIMLQISP